MRSIQFSCDGLCQMLMELMLNESTIRIRVEKRKKPERKGRDFWLHKKALNE